MSSHVCRLYGLVIASPFALPGAKPVHATSEPPDVVVLWQAETAWRDIACHIAFPSETEGAPDLGETPNGDFCVIWRDELWFMINPCNDQITVICRAAKLEFAPTVLVGLIMGLLLHRRGMLCLHGAVLSWADRTIALLGQSGAGKSTTAAALVSQGATLLSDDMVVLRPEDGQYLVQPGCMNIRLMSSAKSKILSENAELQVAPYADKLLWDVSNAHDTSAGGEPNASRLDAIYILDALSARDTVQTGPDLPPKLALRHLLEAWYPPSFRHLLTQQRLDDIRNVAATIPVIHLRFPRRWDILPALAQALRG